jgi:protoporphyrinogen oxidase
MSAFSRRELLTTVLGGAVAAAACRSRPFRPKFAGELYGQNSERGHRLRDGSCPEAQGVEKRGVVIIGAGAAGLAAAWKLERSGFHDFEVLELEDHIGGTSASGANRYFAYPWGAHYVPAPRADNTALTELLTEMGVIQGADAHGSPIVAEELLCRAPQERLFIGGRWEEGLFPRLGASREDLRQLQAFNAEVDRWVGFRDLQGRRAFTVPSTAGGDHPDLDALDQISMAEWLRQRRWDSRRLRWFIEYGCRDDYGGTLDTISAYAGLFYFAARVDRPGDKGAEFIAWPEGNDRIIQHLAGAADGRIRTAIGVADVVPLPRGVRVKAVDFHRGPLAFEADQVIVALPRYAASRIVAPLREASARPPQPTYSSWVVANITLGTRPREDTFPLAWDNVLYDSKSLGYVVATHQLGRDYGPTVWTWYLPLLDGSPAEQRQILQGTDWQHWVDVVLSDLTRAHPDLIPRILQMDVWRWGHAMVRPTPGLLRSGALHQARQPIGPIFFAHTDLSGMALFEEAQHWGVAAAEAVLTARGLPFRSSL